MASSSGARAEMEDQVAAMLGGGQTVGGVVSDPLGTTQQVVCLHYITPASSNHCS